MLDRDELLAQVARDYYIGQLTQDEIGRRIKASRSTVSRLLQQAIDRGIVRITIDYPLERAHELEAQLCARFGIREAQVLLVKGRTEDETRAGMGALAARVVDREVQVGTVFGISYGRSLASTVEALDSLPRANVTVVPIIGALGSNNPLIDGPELTRRIAQNYGGEFRYLPVPLLVDDARVRNVLLQSPQISEVLALARRANVVLIGIGALAPDTTSLIWAGYLNSRDLDHVRESGAVGHMVGQFYDIRGDLIDTDLNDRAIGIGIRTLSHIETVIAVAGGQTKAEAILGALRGRYLNVLITDDSAARRVLELSGDWE